MGARAGTEACGGVGRLCVGDAREEGLADASPEAVLLASERSSRASHECMHGCCVNSCI